MEKGHFRCDANVSLRRRGETALGTRTELKNLNSFRFVESAILSEARRQAEILDGGGEVRQATMAYDVDRDRTRVLRSKEDAHDYRYFPDPDLVPLVLSAEVVEKLRAQLPELAEQKYQRFQSEHGLSEQDARQLSAHRDLAEFFEAATAAHGTAQAVANWLLRDVSQALSALNLDVSDSKLTPAALAALIQLVDSGKVTVRSAQQLVPELVRDGGAPETLVRERGLEAVSDTGVLGSAVDEVLAEHGENIAKYRAGEDKVLNFLMGQVMRKMKGKADPGAVRELLLGRLRED
jgi:aspartyl-tRNA(Asn)/glutamyl-tRNA(Gln) amidotransferase subunit B